MEIKISIPKMVLYYFLKNLCSLGAGAVGMVDLPLEVMEPTHNKQSFANVKQYNHLLKSMESYLVQYWKDVGISK